MDFIINNQPYHLVDSLERISAKDSFIHEDNKLGKGTGSWEWHIGSKQNAIGYNFFGNQNFSVRCFLRKSDLLNLLEEMKFEYWNPSQNYRGKGRFNEIWQERINEINALSEEFLYFNFREHDNRKSSDTRLYAKKPGNDTYGNEYYGLIRKLMLLNITYVSILKLMNEAGDTLFYFKIFSESSTETFENVIEENIVAKINENRAIPETEKLQLVKSRIGQGIFRERLLAEFPVCPITLVDEPKFLIASHIKPWRLSSNIERLDAKNGLLFTPTFDKLFDKGYISFNNRREMLISTLINSATRQRFNIQDGQIYGNLPLKGRESYLEYHKSEIFKK